MPPTGAAVAEPDSVVRLGAPVIIPGGAVPGAITVAAIGVSDGGNVPLPPSSAPHASASSPALANRSSGRLARSRRISWSTPGGMPGACCDGTGGADIMCAAMISPMPSPSNGTRPTTRW